MAKSLKNCLFSVAEMYESDRLTIKSGISGIQLMESAGSAIVREIRKRWSPRKTIVLCGPGNNGGDGFVVARLLSQRGWSVRVLLLGDRAKLKGDAKTNSDLWPYDIHTLSPKGIEGAQLIVDAVFGAGLTRDVDGVIAKTLKAVEKKNIPVVAVDTPSGIHGDTGQVMGRSLPADVTVTFARAKTGHYLMPGRAYCGKLVVADIGIPDHVIEKINPKALLNDPKDLFPWPDLNAHKYNRGHGVIIGGQKMTGATRLAAACARRVGAGLVTISAHGTASLIYRQAEPGNIVSTDAIETHLTDPRKNAFLMGPGLGITDENKSLLKQILKSNKDLVLDADALTMLADHNWKKRAKQTLLTPHEGEFARIFPKISGSKLEKARLGAKKSNCVVLLKGPDTVIAAPDGRASINATGTPWLATAGSGDGLAGICLGLMAQGLDGYDAARLGVWLHGMCAEQFGEGFIAEDIVTILPTVLKTIKK